MCGIAGIIADETALLNNIDAMAGTMAHRGPDGEGFFEWNNVALGHRRLSVIDLSPLGAQPMHYLNRYTITYNGEIYNYKELRTTLQNSGYQFISASDTEVILAAYDYWGTQCLQQFNGMFAFAILDTQKNNLFFARDRFGVKPFYYYQIPGLFAFASEIKAFTVLPGWQATANMPKVYDYLNSGLQDHSRETMFNRVFQLPAGFYMEYDLFCGCVSTLQWFDIKKQTVTLSSNPATDFRTYFNQAVSLRLRADVKTGSCLSGGIDSSSIVLTVNQLLQQQNMAAAQETVSSCFEEKAFDEQTYIDAVTAQANCISHKVFPQLSQLYQDLGKIVWHQDEPFESTSIFAQWAVFKKAREADITVMLDGQGADELLAGYHAYYGIYFAQLVKEKKYRKLLAEIKGLKKTGIYGNSFILREFAKNVLPDGFWRRLKKLRYANADWINTGKITRQKINNQHTVASFSYQQITNSNLPKLLHWEDRNSMAFSVEARLPFLDAHLAPWLFHLPVSQKINKGVTKTIIRQSLANLLPAKVLNRYDKMGFVTPELLWMQANKNELLIDLENAITITNGVITPQILIRFQRMVEGKIPFDATIWRALCFAKWMEMFNVQLTNA